MRARGDQRGIDRPNVAAAGRGCTLQRALAGLAAFGERASRSDAPASGGGGGGGGGGVDEVELMGRVARGDVDAQRQVVRRLLRRVEGLCRAVLRHRAAALDVRQVSMLQVLKSAHQFTPASTLERFADGITVRTLLRAADSKRSAHEAPADLESGTIDSMGESAPLARQYLDRISEQERLVVSMRYVLGYPIEEIAEMTGLPENAVKIRLLRARDVMRRMCRREQFLFDGSRCKVED